VFLPVADMLLSFSLLSVSPKREYSNVVCVEMRVDEPNKRIQRRERKRPKKEQKKKARERLTNK
jgi:c-di-GMP-binding flagellar brake protein YcgR